MDDGGAEETAADARAVGIREATVATFPVAAVAGRDIAPPIAAAGTVSVAGPLDAVEGISWPVDIAACEGRRRRTLAGVRSEQEAGKWESKGPRRARAGVQK